MPGLLQHSRNICCIVYNDNITTVNRKDGHCCDSFQRPGETPIMQQYIEAGCHLTATNCSIMLSTPVISIDHVAAAIVAGRKSTGTFAGWSTAQRETFDVPAQRPRSITRVRNKLPIEIKRINDSTRNINAVSCRYLVEHLIKWSGCVASFPDSF